MKQRRWLDPLLLALLAIVLIAPLFRLEYLDNWPSIESTFISDARMLRDHLPHPGWQPLWYLGTRFDYIYPPALRYGTALISLAAGVSTARAYHLYVAVFYVLGILAIWWLVRVGSQSRMQAALAGLAAALVSPSAFLLETVRLDNGDWLPHRLFVLMRYGEGPHVSALAVLPAALAATLLALRHKSRPWLVAAAVLSALVVSNNFYGAFALGIFFPLLVWSVFVADRSAATLARAAAVALLAWGLCAFWLTPSYVHVTMVNLHTVAEPGNLPSTLAGLVALLLVGGFGWFWCGGRSERSWPVFIGSAAALMIFYVGGFFYAHLRIAGDTARMIPELDIAITLAAVGVIGWMWNRPRFHAVACALIALMLAPAAIYFRHPWKSFARSPRLDTQYAWQMAHWVETNLPDRRVMPSGMVRFWMDAWTDNVQSDGGSKQGLLNSELPVAAWQLLSEKGIDLARLWLQAMGASAVIVASPGSREFYLDFLTPGKFTTALPRLWDDGHNTVIYGVPRIHDSLGRVVDTAAMQTMPPFFGGDDIAGLRRYLAQVERPGQPEVSVEWKGYDEIHLSATLGKGEELLLQETFDPAWHAYENGRSIPIQMDRPMDFMRIETGEGRHDVTLRFETPLENRVGQGMFVLAALACVALLRPRRKENGADERT